jgi:hypothetical protein
MAYCTPVSYELPCFLHKDKTIFINLIISCSFKNGEDDGMEAYCDAADDSFWNEDDTEFSPF